MSVSYATLLSDTALNVGLDPGSLSALQTSQLALCIADAVNWAYYPPNRRVFWPEIVLTQTITLTDGKFAYSLVNSNPRFALWSDDPRLPNSTAYAIRIRSQDSGGIYPDTTAGTVFAFYMPTWTTASTIPDSLSRPIRFKASSLFRAMFNAEDLASKADSDAQNELDEEWIKTSHLTATVILSNYFAHGTWR